MSASAQSIAEASAGLSFSQTVSRDLAHRRALAEVFVADSAEVGDGSYVVAMQVPRAHSLWCDRRVPYHDTLATLEASRQATFVIVHRHLAVPIGPPFTLHRVAFEVVDLEGYRDDETAPLEAVWHAQVVDRQLREGMLTELTLQGRLLADGFQIATLEGDIAFLAPEEYETIRAVQRAQAPRDRTPASGHASRVDPALVGRFDERNVVIGDAAPPPGDDGKVDYRLIVDQRHPAFYDHPQDHVPGPLMVEAYRQAALLTAHRAGALPSPVAAVTGCHGKFDGFCEQDAPATCSAAVAGVLDGRVTVALELHQLGKRLADATIELTPYP